MIQLIESATNRSKQMNITQPLTQESIKMARDWFAANCLACIAEIESGAVRVNDKATCIDGYLREQAEFLAGNRDHTFTFWQRANYFQTGKCVPLLAS
jgi:hypothetical protein